MKRTVLTEELDCSNNSLIDLSGLIMCKNIIILNCSNNNLAELPHYVLMQYLSVLDGSFNLLKKTFTLPDFLTGSNIWK